MGESSKSERRSSGWMTLPRRPENCPAGLEYLIKTDQLLIYQNNLEILEGVIGYERRNKFIIKNGEGQKLYFAAESSSFFASNFCGNLRPFNLNIMDKSRQTVMNLHRRLACNTCCFPCCLQRMKVNAQTLVGTVEQTWSVLRPTFAVKNASGETVLSIKGPLRTTNIHGEVEFKVMSGDQQVGRIAKHWSGFIRASFTDGDNFGISFPMELDVRTKAVMLGACFLIDAMFFGK